MADIVLFGATGYTGRLTAQALFRRGARFAVAGRNAHKLEQLASETGNPEIIEASVGDVQGLARALEGAKVLVTCVGPFSRLGDTAADAALNAGVDYIDSTGEGTFIDRLIKTRGRRAKKQQIAMVPALGFDEVPADVAATLATEGLEKADLTLTYALPTTPSAGTAKSVIDIASAPATWIVDGRRIEVRIGEHTRWAPMPPPLGPRFSVSYPLAEGHLAPLHLDLNSLRLYGTASRVRALTFKALPAFNAALSLRPVRRVADAAIERFIPEPEGPRRDARWTILAEARSSRRRRNVVLTGSDVYGLTAELLSAGALHLARNGSEDVGVLAPVQAIGLDNLQKQLIEHGVTIDTFES